MTSKEKLLRMEYNKVCNMLYTTTDETEITNLTMRKKEIEQEVDELESKER